MAAFVELINDRKRAEAAERLSLNALAAQGDGKAIKENIEDLSKP